MAISTLTFAQGTSKLVEVYYFHSTMRCVTCKAVEAGAKKCLEKNFTQELKDDKVKLIVLNVDEAKNEKLVNKFQASGSNLVIVSKVNGKEKVEDLTTFAFQNAKNKPDYYVEMLKKKIEEKLK